MKKKLLATGVIISSCLIPLEARAASFTGLNIFGDSLVDSGNLFNTTEVLFPTVGLPAIPPSPPYQEEKFQRPHLDWKCRQIPGPFTHIDNRFGAPFSHHTATHLGY